MDPTRALAAEAQDEALAAEAASPLGQEAPSPGEGTPHDQVRLYARELRTLREELEHCAQQRAELEPVLSQLRVCAIDLHGKIESHQQTLERMERSSIAVLHWMVRAADRRDGESLAHAQRVGYYSRALAETLEMTPHECEQMELAGTLHDAGRVEWPDTILLKRGALSQEERSSIEAHCELSRALEIAGSPRLTSVAQAIAHHHEHWDGSGYPTGLTGDAIPLPARIVHLADVYDTLRTAFRYKSTQSHIAACHAILQGDRRVSPDHFAPELIDAFGKAAERFADAAVSED